MLLIVASVAGVAGAAGTCAFAGPRLAAAFITRTLRHLLTDRQLQKEVDKAAKHLATTDDLAAVMWAPAMERGILGALNGMFADPVFKQRFKTLIQDITKDEDLRSTITCGVSEAMHNSDLQNQVKAVIIENMNDEELQAEFLKRAIKSIKGGIREAMSDMELREVITAAIRESFEDPRLYGILRHVVMEALSDDQIHKSAITGVLGAVNPFSRKKGPSQQPSPRPSSPEEPGESSERARRHSAADPADGGSYRRHSERTALCVPLAREKSR